MKYILCTILLGISFLEAVGQPPPEDFMYQRDQLRFSHSISCEEVRVIKGMVDDFDQARQSTAILGSVKNGEQYTTFIPLVSFDYDVTYSVVCDLNILHFSIARSEDDPQMEVVHIYPGVEQVPANILKWYIQFSQAVNPVKIYEHIHFLDPAGQPIDRSILNLGTPLLSSDGKLLTVWIEPGRQKRLLGPNEHLGAVFKENQSYTLLIDASLKNAEGVPMEAEVKHSFTTTAADRTKPSLDDWTVSPLQANTSQALTIAGRAQLDYGSLLDAFGVYYEDERVEGALQYNSTNATISFIPVAPWKVGPYVIRIGYQLEDLAGNNLRYLFDRPVGSGSGSEGEEELEFIIEVEVGE